MIKLKKGDIVIIKGNETEIYFYTGLFDKMKFDNIPCVFLATDLKNKNTFSRFSQQKLKENGYII